VAREKHTDRMYLVLSSEFFGERCAHDFSSFTAGSSEVSLEGDQPCHTRSIFGIHTLRDFLREEETSAERFAIVVFEPRS
jgi:hypothetical protein